ncbi:unnamed protein product, partial [Iphiclides podalirius]
MFGFRTPAKRVTGDEREISPISPREGPSTAAPSPKDQIQRSKVRRSIGDWEAEINTGPQGKGTKLVPAARSKTNIAPSSSSRPSPERGGASPVKNKTTYVDRVAEARACLNKAKLHLSNSRNLKTDIKNDSKQRNMKYQKDTLKEQINDKVKRKVKEKAF